MDGCQTNALSDSMTRLQTSSTMNGHGLGPLMHCCKLRQKTSCRRRKSCQSVILSCALLSLVIECLALGYGFKVMVFVEVWPVQQASLLPATRYIISSCNNNFVWLLGLPSAGFSFYAEPDMMVWC